ncbi:zinc finger MYM-type protein 1-like [Aphis craccivora]|nr:zinc finger MYM-type protein 1-like [Aphis craccivora]
MSIQRDILDAIGFKEILNIVKKSSSLMNQMLSA